MANNKIQYFGIKFPFTINNVHGLFVDLNKQIEDKAASEIAHVLLTRKGERLRKPDFGTNLIDYIFNMNDSLTIRDVQNEAADAVAKYVPNVNLVSINVVTGSDDNTINIDLKYQIKKGQTTEDNRMVITL